MVDSRTLQILITAKDKASKELRKVQTAAEKMEPTIKKIRNVGAVAFTALTASAIKFTDVAVKFDATKIAFNRMSASMGQNGDEILSAMKRASAGTVSETDLMLSANKAYALGVAENAEQFTSLMEVARLKGREMGLTTTQAFNDIVTGVGRGSVMILDNLGIIIKASEAQKLYANILGKTVDELTEVEKKEALKVAVIEQGIKSVENAGVLTLTYSEKVQILKAKLTDTSAVIGKTLLPVLDKVYDKISPIIDKTSKWIKENQELTAKLIIGAIALAGVATALSILYLSLGPVIKTVFILAKTLQFLASSPIAILVVALGILIYTVYKIYKDWNVYAPYLILVWEKIKEGIVYALEQLGLKIALIFKSISDGVQTTLNSLIVKINKWLSYIPGVNDPINFRFEVDEAQEVIGLLNESTERHKVKLQDIEAQYQSNVIAILEVDEKKKGLAETIETVTKKIEDETKNLEDLGGASEEVGKTTDSLSEKMEAFHKGLDDAFIESIAKVKELNAEMEKLKTGRVIGERGEKDELVNAYLDQEQKVADAQAEFNRASEEEDKASALEKLNAETAILEQHKAIAISFEQEISNQREYLRKSDLEKAVLKYQKEMHAISQKYELEANKIQEQLNLEKNKLKILDQIEKIEVQLKDKYRAIDEKATTESINRQIEQYNKLAKSITLAKQGRTSGFVEVGAGVEARARQGVNTMINVTVNGDVSGEELVQKVENSLVGKLSLNSRIAI